MRMWMMTSRAFTTKYGIKTIAKVLYSSHSLSSNFMRVSRRGRKHVKNPHSHWLALN
jgi:hypothetical protein